VSREYCQNKFESVSKNNIAENDVLNEVYHIAIWYLKNNNNYYFYLTTAKTMYLVYLCAL